MLKLKKKNQASKDVQLSQQNERTQLGSSHIPQDRGHVVNPAATTAKAPLSSFEIFWRTNQGLLPVSKEQAEIIYNAGKIAGATESHIKTMQTLRQGFSQ